jgi:hypothetical protein
LIDLGIIEYGKSSFVSPMMLIKKCTEAADKSKGHKDAKKRDRKP